MTRATNPPCLVVDTNVLKVAEGLHPNASDACRAACIELLRRLEAGAIAGVDSAGEITTEYIVSLREAKTAGLGVKMAKRLHRRRRDVAVCREVELTPIDEPPGSYEEVPESLRDFDIDDQKFLGVAAADEGRPQVFTAVDNEWWERKQHFVDAGLDIQFLCPGYHLDRHPAIESGSES